MTTLWEMAAHLAIVDDVSGDVLFSSCPYSHEMSLMRSGTELSEFLRIFLPTLLERKF